MHWPALSLHAEEQTPLEQYRLQSEKEANFKILVMLTTAEHQSARNRKHDITCAINTIYPPGVFCSIISSIERNWEPM